MHTLIQDVHKTSAFPHIAKGVSEDYVLDSEYINASFPISIQETTILNYNT